MFKKTALVLALAMLMTPLYPTVGMTWNSPQPQFDQYRDSHYRGYNYRDNRYNHHRYRDYHGDDAAIWGLTGLILGTILVAAALQPSPPPQPVEYYAPQTQVYNYPPYVPPGMCRWERYILDGYGRMVLDSLGQPVKEYTLGTCQYPPN